MMSQSLIVVALAAVVAPAAVGAQNVAGPNSAGTNRDVLRPACAGTLRVNLLEGRQLCTLPRFMPKWVHGMDAQNSFMRLIFSWRVSSYSEKTGFGLIQSDPLRGAFLRWLYEYAVHINLLLDFGGSLYRCRPALPLDRLDKLDRLDRLLHARRIQIRMPIAHQWLRLNIEVLHRHLHQRSTFGQAE